VAAPVLGLSPAELAGIKDSLAAGKRPRVVFTARAGQMAGNAGHVVELTDPAGSEEWIVVRFGQDELPFSPADLTVAGRRQAADDLRVRPARVRGHTTRVATVPASRPAPVTTQRATTPRAIAQREEARVPARRTTVAESPKQAESSKPTVAAPEVKPPRQPRPAKVPAPLVVTLTYSDQRWTVAAQHGSKSLTKPFPIAPADAMRIVALIEVPGVHDAIAGILAAERAAAETRAERLRAELAEIESRLAELGSAR
jgi:hypothetical protein